jgi:hypothetical protein
VTHPRRGAEEGGGAPAGGCRVTGTAHGYFVACPCILMSHFLAFARSRPRSLFPRPLPLHDSPIQSNERQTGLAYRAPPMLLCVVYCYLLNLILFIQQRATIRARLHQECCPAPNPDIRTLQNAGTACPPSPPLADDRDPLSTTTALLQASLGPGSRSSYPFFCFFLARAFDGPARFG